VGFPQATVQYDRPQRAAGDSKYSLRALFRLAYDGIISFSDLPLRLVTLLGFAVSAAAVAYALYIVTWRLTTGSQLPGFATLVAAVSFLGGMQLMAIGICGEYIARIYREVKRRPVYLVHERIESPAEVGAAEPSPPIETSSPIAAPAPHTPACELV
jgi:hypothetical protein